VDKTKYWVKKALENYSDEEIANFENCIDLFKCLAEDYMKNPSYENELNLKYFMVTATKEMKYLLLSEVPFLENSVKTKNEVAGMLGSFFYLGNERNNLEDNWPNYWSPGDEKSSFFLKEVKSGI
jgi:hypothetical protein